MSVTRIFLLKKSSIQVKIQTIILINFAWFVISKLYCCRAQRGSTLILCLLTPCVLYGPRYLDYSCLSVAITRKRGSSLQSPRDWGWGSQASIASHVRRFKQTVVPRSLIVTAEWKYNRPRAKSRRAAHRLFMSWALSIVIVEERNYSSTRELHWTVAEN